MSTKRIIFILFLVLIIIFPSPLPLNTPLNTYEKAEAYGGTSSTDVGNLPPEYQNVKVVVRGQELNINVVVSDYNSYYDIAKVTVDILDINGDFVSGFQYQPVYIPIPGLAPKREDRFTNTRGNLLIPEKCSVQYERYPVEYIERNTLTVNFVFKPIDGVEIIIKTLDRSSESAIMRVQYASSWFGTSTGDPRVSIGGMEMYRSTLISTIGGIVVAGIVLEIRRNSNYWAKRLEKTEKIEHGNYYSISLITLAYFTFIGTFISSKFVFIFILMSGFTPQFITFLSPFVLLSYVRNFQLTVISTIVAVTNAILHFKHNQHRLFWSLILTVMMIGGIGGAIYMFSYDMSSENMLTWLVLFSLVLMLILDNQALVNYPKVLDNLKHNYCTKCRYLWRISQKQRFRAIRKIGSTKTPVPTVVTDIGSLKNEYELRRVKDTEIKSVLDNIEPDLSREPMKVKVYKSGVVIEQNALLDVGLNALKAYLKKYQGLGISKVELEGHNIKSITITKAKNVKRIVPEDKKEDNFDDIFKSVEGLSDITKEEKKSPSKEKNDDVENEIMNLTDEDLT